MTTNGQTWSDELFEMVCKTKNIVTIVSIESLKPDMSMQTMGKNYDIKKSEELIKNLNINIMKEIKMYLKYMIVGVS